MHDLLNATTSKATRRKRDPEPRAVVRNLARLQNRDEPPIRPLLIEEDSDVDSEDQFDEDGMYIGTSYGWSTFDEGWHCD